METVADVEKTIEGAKDALTVKRVFGEPYVKNGVTVIPAAKVQGGAGGGGGEGPEGQGRGTGSGFGVNARPAGVYVVKDDDVVWRPAVDVNRIILGAQVVAVLALLLARTVVKSRAKVAAARALD
ncbi:MAG TPA: spore germination protein GerW family protein [Actinomycetota bacterium]|nr:spore germination protein GerW family protein [Actinomycetota bacterium]